MVTLRLHKLVCSYSDYMISYAWKGDPLLQHVIRLTLTRDTGDLVAF